MEYTKKNSLVKHMSRKHPPAVHEAETGNAQQVKCEACEQQAAIAEIDGLRLCAACGEVLTRQNNVAVHPIARPAPHSFVLTVTVQFGHNE